MNFYFSLLTPEHKKLPLYIAGIGHDKPQRHVCRDKEFPYYQFAYCTAGKGIFRIDGKEYTIEEGMMFCFEPGIPHEYYTLTEDFSTRWIIFMGADMDVIMDNVNIERRYEFYQMSPLSRKSHIKYFGSIFLYFEKHLRLQINPRKCNMIVTG